MDLDALKQSGFAVLVYTFSSLKLSLSRHNLKGKKLNLEYSPEIQLDVVVQVFPTSPESS